VHTAGTNWHKEQKDDPADRAECITVDRGDGVLVGE
jgi:hypothetical protein